MTNSELRNEIHRLIESYDNSRQAAACGSGIFYDRISPSEINDLENLIVLDDSNPDDEPIDIDEELYIEFEDEDDEEDDDIDEDEDEDEEDDIDELST